MSSQKKLFIGTLIALIGIFIGGIYFYNSLESKKIQTVVDKDPKALVRDHSPSKGSAILRVTLVEFLDPECESCAFFHPIVKKILKKHEGKIHYVIRYAPFHPNSKFAVAILEAARRQGKYWETLDLLFSKLSEWGDHHNPQPELIWSYLPALGLDVDRLRTDMKDESITNLIEQDIKDGKSFSVRRTPTFFINGQPLQRFGENELIEAIERELSVLD